ncbi:unnamed protein product [Bursaphelenchus xylophilus]|uniref:(pine wood nematode) hypothetical protein n=1 Tax=Bursaphelenchus xylophilus TaxID=6326 RepID=A0A1I7RTK2_BURXY|nr:unnamed protein product [Bursaphelenchus xylophilus]CAG9122378.1 unnamed protein product [Bursaphelenchus xylophilus]
MQWGHALILLVSATAFYVVSADWRTYGKIWSKDHGGEANPDFRGHYKINVFIEPDQFLASCGKTKADAKGRYDITCTPLIVPFTDPGKLVKVIPIPYYVCCPTKYRRRRSSPSTISWICCFFMSECGHNLHRRDS